MLVCSTVFLRATAFGELVSGSGIDSGSRSDSDSGSGIRKYGGSRGWCASRMK